MLNHLEKLDLDMLWLFPRNMYISPFACQSKKIVFDYSSREKLLMIQERCANKTRILCLVVLQ
jgi:hypothetical protein